MITFGVISDVHWGIDRGTRLGSTAPGLIKKIVNALNKIKDLDCVIDLGDRIEDVDREKDLESLREFSREIRKLRAPYYPLLGNHDLRNLSVEDNESVLGTPVGFRSVVVRETKFIFLNAQDPSRNGSGGSISGEQIKKLRMELQKDRLPTLVFVHQLLDEQDIRGNIYFKEWRNGDYCFVSSRKKVREVLETNGQVCAVFQGHAHWNRLQHISGIPYITQGSVTESGNLPRGGILKPAGYYGLVTFTRKRLYIHIKGRYPVIFSLSRAELGPRCTNFR